MFPYTQDYISLTPEDVLRLYRFRFRITVKSMKATVKIRPFTIEDEQTFPSDMYDPEGLPIVAQVGRCLCVGVDGEQFTTSADSLKFREAVSDVDSEGYVTYRNTDSRMIWFVVLHRPFHLLRPNGKVWKSQPEGGVITWDGREKKPNMRVKTLSSFIKTYLLFGFPVSVRYEGWEQHVLSVQEGGEEGVLPSGRTILTLHEWELFQEEAIKNNYQKLDLLL